MFAWLGDHLGTILLTLALAGAVIWIVLSMRKAKKNGGNPCCGSCSHCAMRGACCQREPQSPSGSV